MSAVLVGVAVEVATDFTPWDSLVPLKTNTTTTTTENPKSTFIAHFGL